MIASDITTALFSLILATRDLHGRLMERPDAWTYENTAVATTVDESKRENVEKKECNTRTSQEVTHPSTLFPPKHA